MSNTLTKETNEVIVPGTPGTPGYSYPVLTPHYEWIAVTFGTLPTGGPFVSQLIGGHEYPIGGAGISVFATAVKKVTYTLDTVVVPATPGTPPSVLTDYNEGWNAGARSIRFFTNNGVITCTVPSTTVGAAFGMSHDDLDASLDGMHWAFLMKRGETSIWLGNTELVIGVSYTDSTVFKIIRRDGLIQFYTDATLRFTTVDPTPSRPMFADASLWRGGDSIDNPTLHGEEDFVNTMLGLRMLGGVSMNQATMEMTYLTMTSGYNVGATMSLRSLTMHGADHLEGTGVMSMQPVTMLAYQTGVLPTYNRASMAFATMSIGASSRSGELLHGDLTMRGLRMLAADHPYGDGQNTMEYPIMFAVSEGNGAGTMTSTPAASSSMSGETLVIGLLSESGNFVETLLGVRLVPATASTTFTAAPHIDTAAAFIDALMRSTVVIGADVPLVDEDNEAWVLNLDTNATSVYEQYPFNSFAKIGTSYYGARADGVYLLEGNDDNGMPIHASASFGRMNFGTLNKKRIKNVLAAASSDDTVYLKVIVEQGEDDETEYIYQARNFSKAMAVQRVDVGQGIRANYLTFEVFNKNGADFELEQLRFDVIDIARSTS